MILNHSQHCTVAMVMSVSLSISYKRRSLCPLMHFQNELYGLCVVPLCFPWYPYALSGTPYVLRVPVCSQLYPNTLRSTHALRVSLCSRC